MSAAETTLNPVTRIIERLSADGWTTEMLQNFPEAVGRIYRKAGEYEIDVENVIGGVSVAVYDSGLNIVGDKAEFSEWIVGLLHAQMLRTAIEQEGRTAEEAMAEYASFAKANAPAPLSYCACLNGRTCPAHDV